MFNLEKIEQGIYWDNEENKNYQETHYRCHWLGNGIIVCESICKNQYGSAFGNEYGYRLENQENPNWDMDWTDIEN